MPGPKARADGPDTSRAAARRAMPQAGTWRAKILDVLTNSWPEGMTGEQVALEVGRMWHQISPRLTELRDTGWIVEEGTRAVSSGVQATVWLRVP